MTKIRIVDEFMGRGKTTTAIEYMKSHKEKKIIYATPFMSECERIIKDCPFMQIPRDDVCAGAKTGSFFWLLEQGRSIATTHALLEQLEKTELAKLKKADCDVLFMDEVIQPFTCEEVSRDDFKALVSTGHIQIAENGTIAFSAAYEGSLSKIKNIAANRNIFMVNPLENYKKKYMALVSAMLPDLWNCFKEIWVLTHAFEHSYLRCFFNMNQISYEYAHIFSGNFLSGKANTPLNIPKIDIYEAENLNAIGDKRGALSKSWYEKNARKPQVMRKLRNNIGNYFLNIKKVKIADLCWSTIKEYRYLLESRGYKGNEAFLACNARATNDYQERTVAAYLINRFMIPDIANFLRNNGVTFDEDQMMLHEMLQWIYRTAIRNRQEISLYIPALRMRKLLKEFIVAHQPLYTSMNAPLYMRQTATMPNIRLLERSQPDFQVIMSKPDISMLYVPSNANYTFYGKLIS